MTEILKDLQAQVSGYYEEIIILLPKLVAALIFMMLVWVIASKVANRLKSTIRDRTSDPLFARFISRLFKMIAFIIAFAISLKIIGLAGLATGLVSTAGVGAFILGFAFKDIGEHFLAGIILAFNRPFSIGDLVELDGQKGKVTGLNLRDTHIKTFDGRDVFIPNGNIIKHPLVNYTVDGYIRNEINVGLDYGTDVQAALKVILDSLSSIEGILTKDKKPSVAINNLGASSLNVTAYYWLNTFDSKVNGSNVKIAAVEKILSQLDQHGVNLPGDIIELKNYNNKSLELSGGSLS